MVRWANWYLKINVMLTVIRIGVLVVTVYLRGSRFI